MVIVHVVECVYCFTYIWCIIGYSFSSSEPVTSHQTLLSNPKMRFWWSGDFAGCYIWITAMPYRWRKAMTILARRGIILKSLHPPAFTFALNGNMDHFAPLGNSPHPWIEPPSAWSHAILQSSRRCSPGNRRSINRKYNWNGLIEKNGVITKRSYVDSGEESYSATS